MLFSRETSIVGTSLLFVAYILTCRPFASINIAMVAVEEVVRFYPCLVFRVRGLGLVIAVQMETGLPTCLEFWMDTFRMFVVSIFQSTFLIIIIFIHK